MRIGLVVSIPEDENDPVTRGHYEKGVLSKLQQECPCIVE